MNVRLKRAKELAGYAVQLTKEEGLPTMVRRGAGFVKRRCFGKRARYLPTNKVLEAQRAEMAGKTAADCGLPTISVLTPLYNTPEKYLREFLDSFVGQTAPNGQLCLADASDAAHGDVERIVKEYQQKNQQIVYKKIENKGIAANTNAAAQLATGEYLALADHDDILAPHVARVQGVADRVGGADLQVGPLLVRGGDGQVVVRWGGLVFVERDDDDAGRAGHVPFHELVHTRGRIVIKRGRGLIVTSSSVVVIAWCDVLVPVVQPYTHVGDAGSVPYAGGGPVAGDRADRDDAAVAVALARMALVETGDAPAVRVGQRGGGLAGRVVHPHACVGHGAAHAVDVGRRAP